MDLTLHLSAACNLRCGYCHDGAGERRGYRSMSPEIARKAVDFAFSDVDHRPGIFFYGGEPLLHEPLIRQLADYARRREGGRSCTLHMTTNGTRLTDDFVRFARSVGMNISLSHDGVRAAHDVHRRYADGRSSFDDVHAALARLLAALPYAPVRTTIVPETVEHLPDSFDYFVDNDVRCMIWALDYTAAWTPAAMDRLGRAYRRIARRYSRRMRDRERFYFSPFDGKIATHVRQEHEPRFRCRLGYRQLSVTPDGTLMPCVEWVSDDPDPDWVIGHVLTGVDERRRFAVGRRGAGDKPECEGCALSGRCVHWCSCLNYRTTGCVDRVSPVVCAHERMVMPIVDKLASDLFNRRESVFIHKHYNDLYPFLSLIEDLTRRGGRRR